VRSAKYTPFGDVVARKAEAIARPAAKNGLLVSRKSRIMNSSCSRLDAIENGSRGRKTTAARQRRTPTDASSIDWAMRSAGGRRASRGEAARKAPEAPYPSNATPSAT
jgi:hypothetical protein